jgi:hypothetical protein
MIVQQARGNTRITLFVAQISFLSSLLKRYKQMSDIWKFQVTSHFVRNNLSFEDKNGSVQSLYAIIGFLK